MNKSFYGLPFYPLETVFKDVMQREGITVTALSSGAKFQAFFRRNEDRNNIEDRIYLFYGIEAPVKQGSLISFGKKTYVIINQETEENQCYYKSSAWACNGTITLNNSKVKNIPCYGYSMKGNLVNENFHLSMIDGSMEFITEQNAETSKICVNDTFNEFGQTYEIKNVYYQDGLLHLRCESTLKINPTEQLDINIKGLTKAVYSVGESVRLSAELLLNNEIVQGNVTWESSNPSAASVDPNGNVLFLAKGNVEFSCTWTEKSFVKTTQNVKVEEVVKEYHATLTGRDTMTTSATYTAQLFDPSGQEVSGTWEFSHDFTPNAIVLEVNANTCKIKKTSQAMIESPKTFTLTAKEMNHNIVVTKSVTIKPLF